MKRSFVSIGIVTLVLFLQASLVSAVFGAEQAAPAPAASEPNGPPPKVYFEQTTHDFGAVSPGSSSNCEFKFQNKGEGVLEINDITKTCGCTVPELAKKKYEPGESGTVKIVYNADKSAGIRTRHLYVLSNDPVNPRVELTIKALITEKISFTPEKLDYTLKGKNAGEADLTIKSVDNQPFSITKFEATGNAVVATYDANQKAPEIVIHTKVDLKNPAMSANGRIEIGLTHPECSSITVPFSILSALRCDPPAINIINAEPAKAVSKEIWILSNYDEDFEITSSASKDNSIKVVNQEKMGNRYKLTLEITPPPAKNTARMFTDVLTVSTKTGEKLDVTCRGFYLRK
jgi:hypothetical protein